MYVLCSWYGFTLWVRLKYYKLNWSINGIASSFYEGFKNGNIDDLLDGISLVTEDGILSGFPV